MDVGDILEVELGGFFDCLVVRFKGKGEIKGVFCVWG